MISKKAVILIGILLLIGIFSWIYFLKSSERVVKIGVRQWVVEQAPTKESRILGLGFRDSLSPGTGMLFLFPDIGPGKHAFWMEGIRFPLDIAWIRDGRIVFLERNIPADSRDIFHPSEDADAVLEVNAGELSDVVIGDIVK